MKPLHLTTLALCGYLFLGVACAEAAIDMKPDPDAATGPADKTGEKGPVVGPERHALEPEAPPSKTAGQESADKPTWIVYTLPG
jgi:hypothetical protein